LTRCVSLSNSIDLFILAGEDSVFSVFLRMIGAQPLKILFLLLPSSVSKFGRA
jgi:hypothetical protein